VVGTAFADDGHAHHAILVRHGDDERLLNVLGARVIWQTIPEFLAGQHDALATLGHLLEQGRVQDDAITHIAQVLLAGDIIAAIGALDRARAAA